MSGGLRSRLKAECVLDLVTVRQVMNKIWQLRTEAAAGGDELIRPVHLWIHVTVTASGLSTIRPAVCLFIFCLCLDTQIRDSALCVWTQTHKCKLFSLKTLSVCQSNTHRCALGHPGISSQHWFTFTHTQNFFPRPPPNPTGAWSTHKHSTKRLPQQQLPQHLTQCDCFKSSIWGWRWRGRQLFLVFSQRKESYRIKKTKTQHALLCYCPVKSSQPKPHWSICSVKGFLSMFIW